MGSLRNLVYCDHLPQGCFANNSQNHQMNPKPAPSALGTAIFGLAIAMTPLHAGVVFSESFESPVVSGFDDNTVPSGDNWIGSSGAFNANLRGLYNESVVWPVTPAFSTPYGKQGYSLNYSTTMLTTAQGATGQTITAGVTYTLTFHAAKLASTTTNYLAHLVAFDLADDNTARQNPNTMAGTIVAQATGAITASDMSDFVTIVFTPDGSHPHLGKELGIRFDKASGNAIYDNVRLVVGHDYAPSPAGGEDLSAGGNVTLSWTSMPPNAPATETPVDVWFGTDPEALTQVVDGLVVSSAIVSAPSAGTYYWRIDSHPDGDTNGSPVIGDVFLFTIADTDGDGIPDTWEQQYFGGPTAADAGLDSDTDGLSNLDEYIRGTNPGVDDTDGDGLLDGVETATGTWVSSSNTGTLPLVDDTDDDGLLDGVETNTGTWVSAANTGTSPVDNDRDKDGLLDGVETNTGTLVDKGNTGTDPYDADTDNDGVGDYYEVHASLTDPFVDTDKPNVPYPLPDPDGSVGTPGAPVKVYIMSGQSNMLGYGTVNGTGSNTLQTMVKTQNRFPNLVDAGGAWTQRQDVRYRGVISGIANGPLAPGQGKDSNSIGTELAFGHLMGWYHEEPVLLIKTCIGNRSLGWDVLPPDSPSYEYAGYNYAAYGDATLKWPVGDSPAPWVPGSWYAGYEWDRFFTDESEWAHPHDAETNVVDILDDWTGQYGGTGKPFEGRDFEIAGFVWWQGDKDRYDMGHATRYEQNLVNLINSLRSYYSNRYPGKVADNAPFVLATLGQTAEGDTSPAADVAIMDAQMAVDGETGNYPAFAGNVKTVYSHPLSQGGSSNAHYNSHAATYMLIGDALGRAMLDLQNDVTPPSPVTFAIAPTAVDPDTVGMVATTAIDSSGPVEYFFENLTNATDSGWITGTRWDDTGLAPGSYDYRFKARDAEGNESDWSTTASASPGSDTTAPAPDPMSFASPPTAAGEDSLTMTAATASDINGVEYEFVCTAGGGPGSGWQASPAFQPTGLSPGTEYTYIVRARDAAGNITADSSPASATTDAPDTTAPTPDPMGFAVPPAATGENSISMTATTASDPSGVEYRFNNVTLSSSSAWQDSPTYEQTGLTPGTEYTYTVQARDKSPAQTATAASDPASATTDAPDTTAPSIVTYSPAQGATGVPVDATLTLTFDEDIASGSGFITLKKISDSSTIDIDVADLSQVSVSGDVLAINPTANLEVDTTYAVLVAPTAVDDLAGNGHAGISDDTLWRFTTISPPPAGLLFEDGFETPDVTVAQSGSTGTGGTSKIADTSKWVRASQGHGSGANGIEDEGAGRFTDPVGEQAYRFAYTNSGVTTAHQVIGPLVAGTTYTVSFDVVADAGATPYNMKFLTFDGAGTRNDVRSDSFASKVLVTRSGDAPGDGSYQNVSFSFTPDPVADAAVLGHDLAIRFRGATTSANIDNVSVVSSGGTGGNDFSDWISDFPGVGALDGIDDDADGDGIDNGVENFFGTDPSAFSSGLVSAAVDSGAGTFTFSHPLNDTPADDLNAVYRWSADLASFHADGDSFGGTAVSFSQGTPAGGMVTVTATVTGTPLDRLFVDIEVSN